jgi:hypothetical protein
VIVIDMWFSECFSSTNHGLGLFIEDKSLSLHFALSNQYLIWVFWSLWRAVLFFWGVLSLCRWSFIFA